MDCAYALGIAVWWAALSSFDGVYLPEPVSGGQVMEVWFPAHTATFVPTSSSVAGASITWFGLIPCSSAASPTKILNEEPAWNPFVPAWALSADRLIYVWPEPVPIRADCAIALISPVP